MAAGGATFAAFPAWYATMFSGVSPRVVGSLHPCPARSYEQTRVDSAPRGCTSDQSIANGVGFHFAMPSGKPALVRANHAGELEVRGGPLGIRFVNNEQTAELMRLMGSGPDGDLAAGETALLLRTNQDGSIEVRRVVVGLRDSCGPGYRCLAVRN